MTSISVSYPNKPKEFNLIKAGVETCPKQCKWFLRLIHVKWQTPSLKRMLTKSLFTSQASGVFQCTDSRGKFYKHLMLTFIPLKIPISSFSEKAKSHMKAEN